MLTLTYTEHYEDIGAWVTHTTYQYHVAPEHVADCIRALEPTQNHGNIGNIPNYTYVLDKGQAVKDVAATGMYNSGTCEDYTCVITVRELPTFVPNL